MDHNEDIDKEIRISLSIFWDIAVQGGNEVMLYLSNSFIYAGDLQTFFSLEKKLEVSPPLKLTQAGSVLECFIERVL